MAIGLGLRTNPMIRPAELFLFLSLMYVVV